jgi:glutamate-1-semialdehyde 2,1-aminomutase
VVDFQTAAKGDNIQEIFPWFVVWRIYIVLSLWNVVYYRWLTYEDLDFTIQAIDKVSKHLLN